jgi:hypothetical protein
MVGRPRCGVREQRSILARLKTTEQTPTFIRGRQRGPTN